MPSVRSIRLTSSRNVSERDDASFSSTVIAGVPDRTLGEPSTLSGPSAWTPNVITDSCAATTVYITPRRTRRRHVRAIDHLGFDVLIRYSRDVRSRAFTLIDGMAAARVGKLLISSPPPEVSSERPRPVISA